ncbi:MAG: TonB-dependent receptor [Alcanivoracaceae bacterium]|nr:TonB-dependent receptor [Alcanivoracaceae bacterium]
MKLNYAYKKHRLSPLKKALTIALLGISTITIAQSNEEEKDTNKEESNQAIEEIIVTARRREESLQEIPLAITVYSGEALEEQGVIDITELTKSAPNVNLEVSRATSSTLTAHIRGIGQQDPVAGFEGGVGIYVDDVYLARPQGAVFDVYDVERIEVLRGPQGTLYGKNTIGGAIKYVTKALSDEPEGTFKISLGSFNQIDLLAKGSGALSDNFRIGGSIASFQRDGFGKNLFTGGEHYDKDVVAARVSFEWDVSDSTLVKFSADYSDDNSAPKSGHRLIPGGLNGDPVLDNVFDTRAGIETIDSSRAGLNQNVTQGGVTLSIISDINDSWTFKSITSKRKDDSESLIDFDSLPSNDFDAPVIYENEQFSQEFQLTYSGDRSDGVVGLYYLDANAFDAFDVVLGNLAPPLGITAFTLGDYDTETTAIYADFSFVINEQWQFSIGGRYTRDERSVLVQRETFLGLGSPFFNNADAVSITVPLEGLVPTFRGSRTDSAFTSRASISYSPVDEHNFYATYSEGFKGGGFDPRGAYQFPDVQKGFNPEEVASFELGAKSLWNDGAISTNIALFFMDFTDIQIPGSIAIDTDGDGVDDSFAGTTTNAGEADIWGLEFESTAHLSDSLSANVSIGYINAEYVEWLVNGVDVSDDRVFQNTPEWTASFGLRNEWDMNLFGNAGSLVWLGSVSYQDDVFQFEIPEPLLDQKAYSLVDMSLVWSSADSKYQLGLHGKNLGDKEYKVASYNFPTLGVEGVQSAFYGSPRQIIGSFSVNF